MSSSMPLEENEMQNEPFVPESYCPLWIDDISSTTETLSLQVLMGVKEYLQDPLGVLDALDANYLHPCSLDNMDIQHPHDLRQHFGTYNLSFSFMVLDCIISQYMSLCFNVFVLVKTQFGT